ncbi:unannotated protein [freshwater metagenome]|uniref:Unannotated protein n=1 Tax=freshwater metagenome TaxID=449393 RepID=A0A6J6JS44_9ZZZZ|nr:hypothetical protein [Actinomycetota bacterium]
MSDLNAIGTQDNWICWLCDKPVDPDTSVNSDLGPSVDSFAATRVKKGVAAIERIAHRQCNTMKGKIAPVVPWSKDLLVVDPSPIFETVERLRKKGGREIIARCPDERDANNASEWLLDRLGRLAPELEFTTVVSSGGGQYVLALKIS